MKVIEWLKRLWTHPKVETKYKNLDEYFRSLAEANREMQLELQKGMCVICHGTPVCPELGQDTCDFCLKVVAPEDVKNRWP